MGNAKDSITDLGAAFGEVAVDAMMAQGVLRDIPILGSAVGIARATRSVRDALFLVKLQELVKNFEGVSEAEKQKLRSRLESEEERERIGQKLVFVLERADDLEKAKLIGRCLKVYLEGKIIRDELYRFWHAVDRCFLHDLRLLDEFSLVGVYVSSGAFTLDSTGLIKAEAGYGGGMAYSLTSLGSKFLELILS